MVYYIYIKYHFLRQYGFRKFNIIETLRDLENIISFIALLIIDIEIKTPMNFDFCGVKYIFTNISIYLYVPI